jgi:RNA polymerase sigma-70 factor (ECF subfamily)
VDDYLVRRFEENRPRLTAAAQRMLGSSAEAEDAVQEAWMRLDRTDAETVENLPAWLTTVVARVCLNQLRSRRIRGVQPLESRPEISDDAPDAEQRAELADSVGLALLVVLESLSPDERLAFVMHDMFDLPYDEIAPVVGRYPAATRQTGQPGSAACAGSERPGARPRATAARRRRVSGGYTGG